MTVKKKKKKNQEGGEQITYDNEDTDNALMYVITYLAPEPEEDNKHDVRKQEGGGERKLRMTMRTHRQCTHAHMYT